MLVIGLYDYSTMPRARSCASTLTCWSLLMHFDKIRTALVVELSFTAIIE